MKRAFVFDLDGTLTHEELLPRIAREIGLEDEIRQLTELTIKGVISFDASFRMRFAMLRSVPVQKVRAALSNVHLDEGISKFISDNQTHCYIVTGNLHNWIDPLVDRLGCKVFANRADEDGEYVTRLQPLMLKSQPVLELKTQYDQVIAVGDGANDIPMFEAADLGVAFGGVHPPDAGLIGISDYVVYESDTLCRLLNML